MWGRKEDLKSNVPAGQSGNWRVEKYVVTEEAARFEEMRAAIHGCRRYVPAGNYTRLMCGSGHGSVTVMSDTPDELRDFHMFVYRAHGSILINGLGLGCVVQALLAKPEVTDITVIEKSPDVIALVEPTLRDPRLTVINADAYEWVPPKGRRWNAIWHDIWNDLCTDNLTGMTKLHRKYARRCDYQASWCKGELEYQKRRERANDYSYILGGRP